MNLANLNQAETIKTRLEKQMDTLDVTDPHYERKINDLQKRLVTRYDIIDEATDLARESYIDGIWNKESVEDWLTEIQLPIK